MKKKDDYMFKLEKNISLILEKKENPKILEIGVMFGFLLSGYYIANLPTEEILFFIK